MRDQLAATDRSLDSTNLLLQRTNAKLDATNRITGDMAVSLKGMRSDIHALDGMRSDIHDMAHKLSGSFLFRGVR